MLKLVPLNKHFVLPHTLNFHLLRGEAPLLLSWMLDNSEQKQQWAKSCNFYGHLCNPPSISNIPIHTSIWAPDESFTMNTRPVKPLLCPQLLKKICHLLAVCSKFHANKFQSGWFFFFSQAVGVYKASYEVGSVDHHCNFPPVPLHRSTRRKALRSALQRSCGSSRLFWAEMSHSISAQKLVQISAQDFGLRWRERGFCPSPWWIDCFCPQFAERGWCKNGLEQGLADHRAGNVTALTEPQKKT